MIARLCKVILFFFIGSFFIFIGLGRAQEQEPFVYDPGNRRDPFWSLISPSGTILSYDQDLVFSDLTLEGITYDPQGRSVAVINSAVVTVDGEIGGYKVLEIKNEQVVLMKKGEVYILEIRKER